MKNSKNLLALVFILVAIAASAQQWSNNGNDIYNSNSGNVGIGTSSPGYPLSILMSGTGTGLNLKSSLGAGNARMYINNNFNGGFYAMSDAGSINLMLNSVGYSYFLGGNVGIGTSVPTNILDVSRNMTGPQIIIHNLGGGGGAGFTMIDDLNLGYWKFKSAAAGGFKIRDDASSLDVFVIEKSSLANALYIQAGGNIGIGTSNPTSKLAVNGKIDCKEVEVYLAGWSDFVFAEDYQLRTLTEVEVYVKAHKHLPGLPSEQEVIENGINIGEMNAILLEKIEELTLYMIELKKENEEMKNQIQTLLDK